MATVSMKMATGQTVKRGNVVQVDSAGDLELWDDASVHPYGVALEAAAEGEMVSVYRGGDDALVYVLCEDAVDAGDCLALSSEDGEVTPLDIGSLAPGYHYVLGSASTDGAAGTLCRASIDRFLVFVPTSD